MITTSHKPQAKRITTRTLCSSTDVTNLKKRITMGPGELTEYTNLKKRITMGPGELTESLFFLLIKSLKQQASSLLSLYFFLFKKASSNKQRAHLLTLDMLSIRLYKINN